MSARRKTRSVEAVTKLVVLSAALVRRNPGQAAVAIKAALSDSGGSIGEAARQLGASYSSVQRWIRLLHGQGYLFKVRARGAKLKTGLKKRRSKKAA